MRRFRQVDVFSDEPTLGNPVAVVIDGDGIDDAAMAAFSCWTNLSEVTFLLPPTDPAADYRVRIWCRDRELPFAGHPTLGSAHAWLDSGGVPREPGQVVQECAAGLVPVRIGTGSELAFAAPPLIRSGPPSDEDLARACAVLGLAREQVVDSQWIDNGPGWLGLWLGSAQEVLAVEPDYRAMVGMDLGIAGPWDPEEAAARGADIEVRGLDGTVGEDPVTGSLNASLGQWLTGAGVLPASYVAAQGTVLGRRGRVRVDRVGDQVWVGGNTRSVLAGTLSLDGTIARS